GSQPTVSDEPSKTYYFDFATGQIVQKFIDEQEAIQQAAVKAILTYRDRYLIYSEDYGCEIMYLMGKAYSQEYLELEVPRLIDEALMPDDRILSTENYIVKKVEDELHVTFDIITTITMDRISVEVIM